MTKRVLVSATDAGGAANVAPVAALLSREQRTVYCSRATLRYFEAWEVAATVWADPVLPAATLAGSRPDALLCGTAGYPSPDRELLACAHHAGIRSVAVLDEWYRYAERFQDGAESLPFFPDVVCVPDELARREAVAAGIPSSIIKVTGSPALSSVCDRFEQFATAPPIVPPFMLGAPHPWIVLLSETHATDYGNAPGKCGPVGSCLGYTESSVALDLAHAVRQIARRCTIIEKLHPAATDSGAITHLGQDQHWRSVGNVRLDSLLWYADIVVGMRSIALVESSLAGRATLSYQPGLLAPHAPSTSERLGLVGRAPDVCSLTLWLEAHWDSTPRPAILRPPFAARDAAARVRNLLLSESQDTA